jgi:ABC-type transport system involved in multi-copper enzyme maturation permease subunit
MSLAGNLLMLTGLAWGFARRYGTRQPAPIIERSTRFRWQLPAILSRLPIRWPGRVAALVWLDLRQAVPMCLAGIVLACLMTAVSLISESGVDARRLPDQIAGQLAAGTWVVGLLWGAVVGAGVFAGELAPRLEQFWRSRPISPSTWFWVKYLAGLAAVLGVLDLVTIVVGWNSPHGGQGPNRMSVAYIACVPFLHALTYALAVLGTCWLRRPVFAAAAAVLFFFLVSIAFDAIPGGAEFAPINVYNHLFWEKSIAAGEGRLDLTRHGYPIVYGGMAALIVLASVAAWRGALRPYSFGGRGQA